VNNLVSTEVRAMPGAAALPRSNGELVFDAPWQGRVLGMAVATVEALGVDWDEFRTRLIAAIAEAADRPYYESFTAALEQFVADYGVASPDDVTTRAGQVVNES
jgi:nitrile hydratase beta subunit-like protein